MTHGRLGAVRTPPKIPRPERAPRVRSPLIERLAHNVARESSWVGDDFWATTGARSPLIEPAPGDPQARIVTFLWRDEDAAEVLLFVNRLTDERNLSDSLMQRIPGTDIWHLSYRMSSDWRASYCFLTRPPGAKPPWRDADNQIAVRNALDRGRADPRNPETTRNRAGFTQSVVALADAPRQPWVHPRLTGVERRSVQKMSGPMGRRIWLHRPTSTPDSLLLPIVVILDGEIWTSLQDLPTTLDNLYADDLLAPALFVFLDSGGVDKRWQDFHDQGDGVTYIVDQLIPWVRATVPSAGDDVVVVGQSLGALAALRCGVRHPARVTAVLSQSASLWQGEVMDTVGDTQLNSLSVYLEVGRQEWVLREPNLRLAEQLRAAGASVRMRVYNGGHDYACWRGGIADGLVALLPRH